MLPGTSRTRSRSSSGPSRGEDRSRSWGRSSGIEGLRWSPLLAWRLATQPRSRCVLRVWKRRRRHVRCYAAATMITILRYTGIALAMFVLAIVFTTCGDVACDACAHSCCVTADRTDGSRTGVSRLIAPCVASWASANAVTVRSTRDPHRSPMVLTAVSSLARRGVLLRI